MFKTKHNLVFFSNFCTIHLDVDLFDDGILVILGNFSNKTLEKIHDVPGFRGANRHNTNCSFHLQCFVAGLSLVPADDEQRKQHGEDTTAETDK